MNIFGNGRDEVEFVFDCLGGDHSPRTEDQNAEYQHEHCSFFHQTTPFLRVEVPVIAATTLPWALMDCSRCPRRIKTYFSRPLNELFMKTFWRKFSAKGPMSQGETGHPDHQQGIICGVAFARSSLRRIVIYASLVAPRRLASAALLMTRGYLT